MRLHSALGSEDRFHFNFRAKLWRVAFWILEAQNFTRYSKLKFSNVWFKKGLNFANFKPKIYFSIQCWLLSISYLIKFPRQFFFSELIGHCVNADQSENIWSVHGVFILIMEESWKIFNFLIYFIDFLLLLFVMMILEYKNITQPLKC